MIQDNITLAKIVDVISSIASGERNISTIVQNDIYELDAQPDVKYSVFGITQNTHREDEAFVYYSFNLFYINRITNDDRSNEILNQSTAIQVLRNIIRKTCNYLDIEVDPLNQIQYETFIQKFSDVTSGAYAIVTFAIPLDLCVEDYGDSDDL